MKIYPERSSNYNAMKTSCIVDNIIDSVRINKELVDSNCDSMRSCDRVQLKAIAAELETVHKRLEWIINGRY